jgi:hypothetical protein
MGLALIVVMLSKQRVKLTTGAFGTLIDTGLLDAGLLDVQGSEEVSVHITKSLLFGVYVKVELFVPTFEPFTFH